MQRLFPVFNRESHRDRLQSQLMIIAGLGMLTYAIILSLAPIIRLHSVIQNVEYKHWIGLGIWALSFTFLHQQTTRKLPRRDPYLLPMVAMLSGIGLMTIWRLYPNLGLRQTIWLALATLLVYLGLQFPQYLAYLRQYKYLWLVAGLVLTGMTILLGINPSGSGPTLWLEIFGVHFQPSEFLKLLLIVFLAGYFSDERRLASPFLDGLIPTLAVILTAVLLLFFQRDLGTASVFLLIYLGILVSAHRARLFLWLVPLLLLVLGLIGYMVIGTVQSRIDTWLNPFGDPSGASYQIVQSLIAIAEGSLMGTGPGLGSPILVPVSVSDFIFSAIAEELGFIGIVLVLSLIILMVYRGTKISFAGKEPFHRYLSLGLIFYFGMQSALIIGGNIGLLPLTGVTLPFVSYGGSSLLVSFIALLMLLSTSDKVDHNKSQPVAKQTKPALISGGLMALLMVEILTASMISFWFRPYLINRAENPRWTIHDRYVPRGDILDRSNQVIVTNTGLPGSFERTSNHIPLYPVIGYTNPVFGQTGIEDSMFQYLRGYAGYPFAVGFKQDLLYNQPPDGLDVRLTLDLQQQQRADTLLADALNDQNGGAVVLMNAQSGEILAMSSYPYFDAADLEAQWPALADDPRAPLLNRAAQGLYPPGPVLLPFLATSQVELLLDFPNPTDLIVSASQTQTCAFRLSDEASWNALITNGCQEFYQDLVGLMDFASLVSLFEKLGFYDQPNMYLEVPEASSPPANPNVLSAVETIRISPLQAALASASLSNQGIRPGPRIVNAFQDPEGNWVTLPKNESPVQSFEATQVDAAIDLLKIPDVSLWQVTAITETEDGQEITWFLSGTIANWQGQPLVVVVLLEKSAPAAAQAIGNTLLLETLNIPLGQ